MGRTGTTRRRALLATGAAAVGLLTGCSNDEPESRRTPSPSPDPARTEAALRVRLVRASTTLRDEYDAVIARHPSLTDRLTPLRAAVAAHAAALAGPGAKVPQSASASPSPSSSASPSASAGPSGPVPEEPAVALKALAAAERRTADSHTAALNDAAPELARLLASVAAAGAAHAYLLTKGDGR